MEILCPLWTGNHRRRRCRLAVIGWLLALTSGEPFVYDFDIYLLRPVLFGVLLGLYNYHVDSNRAN